MSLIIESVHSDNDRIITEETDDAGNKRLYISAPFMMFGKPNKNKRIYPEDVMDSAVKVYEKNYIKRNRALGELNHPEDSTPNPERAAIMTLELKKDAPFYYGKAKVLSTPMGQIVESLHRDGVTLCLSSRGLGSVKDGKVQSDFVITSAADVVFDPSVESAIIEGIYEWVERDGVWKKAKEACEILTKPNHMSKRALAEAKLAALENFLRKL